MKKAIFVTGLAALLVLIGCSATSVRFDYERGADFSKYRSFDFYQVPEAVDTDRLILKRIHNIIAREMKAKGLAQDTGDPDLLIAAHSQTKDKVDVQNWGYDYADAYHHGYWDMGPTMTTVSQYEEGTLIIDIVDNQDDELIWRGVASRPLPYNPTAETMDRIIDEVVTKALAKYPPSDK